MLLLARIAVWLLFAFCLLLLPLVLQWPILALNPMALAFIRTVEVRNTTAQTLSVTPLGHADQQSDRWPLILVRGPRLYIDADQLGRFRLAPGETLAFHYDDDDDVHMSEIVLEVQGVGALVVPAADHAQSYEISDLAPLAPATGQMIEAVEKAARGFGRPSRLWHLLWIVALGLGTLGWVLRPKGAPAPLVSASR